MLLLCLCLYNSVRGRGRGRVGWPERAGECGIKVIQVMRSPPIAADSENEVETGRAEPCNRAEAEGKPQWTSVSGDEAARNQT